VKVFGTKVAIVSLACMLQVLAGCSRHSKKEHYYLVTSSTKHGYWQSAGAGFAKAAAEYGVTAEMVGPQAFDPQGEVAEFRSAVSRKPAGIIVSVAKEDLLRPEIDSAIAAGIPVITIDSDAPSSRRLYFIGTNNLEAGRLGGARVSGELNGNGNVVFFTIAGQPNLEERLKGYKDAFDGTSIKIADVFDMKGDSGLAMDKAKEYLARTGADKIDAFVCLESTSGKDVAETIKRAGALGRRLVAMDVDTATLNLVADGTIDSTISQKPYTMAYLGLKALDDLHHYPASSTGGGNTLDPYAPYPAFVDTGVTLVDATNVGAIMDAQRRNGVK
jgi:ribose transport system substrate-binding protein